MIVNAGYYPDDYDLPHVSIWQRINRVLWALLVLTVTAIIIGSFLPELQKQRNERAKREQLHQLIDAERAKNSRLKRKIGWLNNSPEYLALVAGEKLDLMQPGVNAILRMEPAKEPVIRPEVPAPAIKRRN